MLLYHVLNNSGLSANALLQSFCCYNQLKQRCTNLFPVAGRITELVLTKRLSMNLLLNIFNQVKKETRSKKIFVFDPNKKVFCSSLCFSIMKPGFVCVDTVFHNYD